MDFNFCKWLLLNNVSTRNGIFIYNRCVYSENEIYEKYRDEILHAVMAIFRVTLIDLKSKNKYTELLLARMLLYSMTDINFCMNVIGMNRRTVNQYNKKPKQPELIGKVMNLITE